MMAVAAPDASLSVQAVSEKVAEGTPMQVHEAQVVNLAAAPQATKILPVVATETTAGYHIAAGKRLLEEQNVDAALSSFIEALRISPQDAEAREGLAKACSKQMPKKQTQAGEEKYQQGLLLQRSKATEESVFDEFLAAAKEGHVVAQREVGVRYSKGIGVAKNLNSAFKWFKQAAKSGDVAAMVALGNCYKNGEGASVDAARAAGWYETAAEKGDPIGKFEWGCCLEAGEGVKKDEARAEGLFKIAAEKGHPAAHTKLGLMSKNNAGVAASWFYKAAKLHDAEGQYRYAKCLDDGIGVRKNIAEAAVWYEKASDQGHFLAKFELGLDLLNGYGVKQDRNRAFELLKEVADEGHADAEFKIGLFYHNGWANIAKDHKAAFKWHYRAACNNHAEAMGFMGWYYENGSGTPKNFPEALNWYEKGAAAEDPFSLMKLGEFSYKGNIFHGIAQDFAKAAQLFQRAADKGNGEALYYLAVFHLDGIFTKPDYVRAFHQLKEAIQKGNKPAQAKLGVALAKILETNPSASLELKLK